MKFKEKVRNKKAQVEGAVADSLRPSIEKLGTKLRLREMIDRLTEWCAANPRRMFIWVVIILSALTLASVIFSFRDIFGSDEGLDFGEIDRTPSVVFDKKAETDNYDSQIREGVRQLGQEALARKNEVDSLLALPVMTHEDSIRVITNYNKIKEIYNFLKDNDFK